MRHLVWFILIAVLLVQQRGGAVPCPDTGCCVPGGAEPCASHQDDRDPCGSPQDGCCDTGDPRQDEGCDSSCPPCVCCLDRSLADPVLTALPPAPAPVCAPRSAAVALVPAPPPSDILKVPKSFLC